MPSIAITQPYEAVYILDPNLGDERISAVTAKYRGIVETGGGTLEKIDVWERRRLAYEVKGRTEGIYVVMQFRAKPPVEAELRRIFQISEDQIRFLIIRRDDEEALLPAAAPTPAAAVPAPAPTVTAPEAVETPQAETEPAPAAAAVEPDAVEAAPAGDTTQIEETPNPVV